MGRYPGLCLGEASGGGCCFFGIFWKDVILRRKSARGGGGGIRERFTGQGVGEPAEDSGRF